MLCGRLGNFPIRSGALAHPIAMRLTSLVAGLMLILPLPAQTPPSPTTLVQLRDRYRPLLIFAAAPDDPSLLAQLTRLKDAAAGLEERDVIVIAVPYRDPAPTEVSLSAAEAQAARRAFHVGPEEFTAILLGKDGGEKYRSKKPVSFDKLRGTIDSMPMRKEEMKDAARH